MANNNAPFGFQVERNIQGASANFAINSYRISTANTHSFGVGDPVTLLSTGYIDRSVATDSPIQGIFLGCQYYDTLQARWQFQPAWQAPTTSVAPVIAMVMDDRSQVLKVQSSGAVITQASVGLNATFTGGGAPNTLTGISTAALDATSLSTTNTLPFRVVGLSEQAGNDNTASYNLVEVIMIAPGLNNTTGI